MEKSPENPVAMTVRLCNCK